MFHTLDISHTVPAHAGGVDLSFKEYVFPLPERVPAHAGGVDLSIQRFLRPVIRVQSPPMRAGWI